jgi:hypothetical protein
MIPQSYYDHAKRRESSGNVFAKNPRSSASGLYQFTDVTWADMMRKYPQLGLTPDGRFDAAQQERAIKPFTEENAAFLGRKGFEPTQPNLYLAHRFGAQGALQLLTADQNAPMAAVVSPAVMKANPDLAGKTVGQLTGNNTMRPPMQIDPRLQGQQPALSVNNQIGPGALTASAAPAEEEGLSYDMAGLPTAMEKAGVYLMGISDPKALGALGAINARDNGSKVVQGADGRFYRIGKNGTSATPINGMPQGLTETQKAFQIKQAQLAAEEQAAIPTKFTKAQSNLQNLDRQWATVGTDIDAAIELAKTANTTGLWSLAKAVPGTDAHKMKGLLDTIGANIGFDKLQAMRDASPTGGALGQVSDFENKLLQAVQGAISQSQDSATLVANLQRIKENFAGLQQDRRQAFASDFGKYYPEQVQKWLQPRDDAAAKPQATGTTQPQGNRKPLTDIFK